MDAVPRDSVHYREYDVSVDGFNIHFLEWGEKGSVIVLLHGSWPWGMARNLDHLSEPLSREYRVIVPDLPGFGLSDDPSSEMGFKEQIEILHEAIKQIGLEKCTFVGISYGGLFSMAWPALYPEDINGSISLDMPPTRYSDPLPRDPRSQAQPFPDRFSNTEEALEYCAKVYPGFSREYMLNQLIIGGIRDDGVVTPPSPSSRRRLLRWDRDFWVDLEGIKTSILLVYGSDSHFFSSELVEKMKSANGKLSLKRVEGATHYLPMTHVEETLEAVKSFMKKLQTQV